MIPRLVVSDVDGTILPYGSQQVSEYVVEVARRCAAAGVLFCPCTGRGLQSLPNVFRYDKMCYRTSITANGMLVRLRGRVIFEGAYRLATLSELWTRLRLCENAGMLCFSNRGELFVVGDVGQLRSVFPQYAKMGMAVDTIPSRTTVVRCNVFLGDGPDLEDRTRRLAASLGASMGDLCFEMGQPGGINVVPYGVSKASAIDRLVAEEGMSFDEVVAFGDGDNDVSMLRRVPHSVAVCDASPLASEAARFHCGSCVEDGVPRYLMSLLS